ncbi:Cytochrome b-c1 complex subunit 7 [Camponotus floridanus]|uniref:Cytochrome b-c1 complex subunit 7 n=1 Tax=Camponotus floridanus TaxID=104421 RepID=E2B281_CAMFO|nr:cytochrome b-c1 complex subunit 7 [Camponotus floridanus]EFN60207.1 Cytochrome b-c1 complex subunit 7 [Camponotus floridanus]
MSKQMNRLISTNFRKWCYNLTGFNQYGLRRDDCLAENEDVKEALKRLPQHIVDERNFRIVRAMLLDTNKRLLPKEQWTKFEEDVPYLQPIVEEVKKEREEREKWNSE